LAVTLKKAMVQYKLWKKGNFSARAPSYVELLVSSRCNLKCVMCNIWPLAEKDPSIAKRELEITEYENLLDELSSLGTRSLCISGGEPLLKKGVFSIIKKAKEKNLFVELITNGTLITNEITQKLLASDVDLVTVSIDAPVAEVHDQIRGAKGLWERSTKGLRTLHDLREMAKSQKPRLAIDYVVNKINCRLIPEMIDLKRSLGFDEIHLLPIIGRTSVAKELFLELDDLRWLKSNLNVIKHKMEKQNLPISKLTPLSSICDDMEEAARGKYKILNVTLPREAKRDISCFAPWVQSTIDPFGNVYPCCYACTFQNSSEDLAHTCWGDEDFPMGNIKQESFLQIWKGPKYQEFRKYCNQNHYKMCQCCGYDFSSSLVMTALLVKRGFLIKNPKCTYQLIKKYRANGN
jgi:MoaA/NifB/PqqE/SkfB family radical SAM enzyme